MTIRYCVDFLILLYTCSKIKECSCIDNMMTEPSELKGGDEICPMCRRPKSKHSPEELLTCSRKMEEFKKNTSGGAGIE